MSPVRLTLPFTFALTPPGVAASGDSRPLAPPPAAAPSSTTWWAWEARRPATP